MYTAVHNMNHHDYKRVNGWKDVEALFLMINKIGASPYPKMIIWMSGQAPILRVSALLSLVIILIREGE